MNKIVTSAPDVEALVISVLGSGWFNVKPEAGDSYTLGLVRADLQGHVTPISRYCRVGLSGFVVKSGQALLGDAFDLVNAACRTLEARSGSGVILDVDVQSGPMRVVDDITKLEISYATLLLEVAVA